MALKKQNKHSKNAGEKSDSFIGAITKGNAITKLSALVLGLGNLIHKQIIHGLLYLVVEVAYIVYMVKFGVQAFVNITTLGTNIQEEVFNEATQLYEYTMGDNSMLFLLYGVITIFVTLGFICILVSSVKSAYKTQVLKENNSHLPTFKDDLRALKHQNLHATLLSIPCLGVLCFTIVPLVFMILIAFTNYDREHQPPGQLFTWVGLKNFKTMFDSGTQLAHTFGPVLGWTLIWAVCATISTFFLGMILAMTINRKETRAKGLWRFLFVLSIAVPQFVTLLTMKTVFNTNGAMNVLLRSLGIISQTASVPFLTNATYAKITILVVNVWIGVPFTLLQTTGILQNIPKDLYEAARMDGANPVTIFLKITLPYMLFVMTPYLITQFAGNINNFNVIFLLTGGGPESLEYYYAGKTDLLVTWLYKLSVVNREYNVGAVVGILIFVVLATLSLVTYRRTGSYKDEGAFQ